jgi:two-component system, LuxR family, sensor kinase FixL
VQQYARFKESRIRAAVFGNSRQFFLMRQSDRADLDDISQDISLSDVTKQTILNYPLPIRSPPKCSPPSPICTPMRFILSAALFTMSRRPKCLTLQHHRCAFRALNIFFGREEPPAWEVPRACCSALGELRGDMITFLTGEHLSNDLNSMPLSWVTILWSMVSAVCLTLGGMYLLVWWKQRGGWVHLLFSCCAIGAAAWAGCELAMMRAETPAQYGAVLRWAHVPVWVIVVSLVGFVRLYLRAGRRWLAWSVCGLRTLALILNFVFTPNLNYREIASLQQLSWWGGETVSAAIGVTNPWTVIGQLSLLLLLALCVDAAITVWRRGERRRALVVGGSMIFFMSVGTSQAILVFWGVLHAPFFVGFAFLGIVAAMAYELSYEVLRAAQLSEEVRENEQRMSLAVDVANFGIWIRDLSRNEIWASNKWRELFGFAPGEPLALDRMLDRVHPDDREAVRQALERAITSDGRYETEYRVVLPDEKLRWITSRGRVEFDDQGRPVRVRGASRDFTARKLAEEAAHHLSGRLIHAQEEAQRELARELHDDLNQSLALLSVELEMFGQNPPAEPQRIAARMEEFSTQVKGLSSEVHRLSHDLHPAKLDQLGLVAAVRGFCKEFALAHEIAIEFTEHDVPRAVPDDAALCLYRIAQEALHNVVKHSGGTVAKVELTRADGHLCLVVTDDGAGFDPQATRTNGSLGLVSMNERARFVGGRLTLESHPGAGTRVKVCVPIAAAEESTPQ